MCMQTQLPTSKISNNTELVKNFGCDRQLHSVLLYIYIEEHTGLACTRAYTQLLDIISNYLFFAVQIGLQ